MDPCTAAEGEAWRRCPEGINKGRDWRSRARSLCTREPLAEHATNREVIQHVEAHHLHRQSSITHYVARLPQTHAGCLCSTVANFLRKVGSIRVATA